MDGKLLRRGGVNTSRGNDEVVVHLNGVPPGVDMPDPEVWGDKAIPESPEPHIMYGIENIDLPDPEVWGMHEEFREEYERRAALEASETTE